MAIALILGTAFVGAILIYFLMSWNDQRNKALFSSRGVRFIPQRNTLLSVLFKERTEVTRDELIKRENIKVFGFHLFNAPTIVVAIPELAGHVLSKEFTNFTNRRIFKFDDPIFSQVLSAALDEQWKRLRAIVTPTFSAGSLRRMKPRIDETVENLLSNFAKTLKADGSEVDVKRLYGSFTMDTIIQVAFGTKVDSLSEPNNPVIVAARKVFSKDQSVKDIVTILVLFTLPKLARLLGMQFQKSTINFFKDFSEKIIKQKKAELKANKENFGKATSFLELVIEAEAELERMEHVPNGDAEGKKAVKYMSTNEMVAQCVLFFLAGYDTTATTITCASYLLALNPKAQEKLYEEIETVLGKLAKEPGNEGKSPVELVTLDNLSKFEYLTGVVNETLRIYAPATATERSAAKDTTIETEDGSVRIDLKAGDIVHFPIYSMHRDTEQFPDPEEFRPERFIGEPAFHKYSYLPFGAGPRNCVARSLALLEAKLAVLHTVREYKFSRGPKTKVPFEMYYQNNFVAPRDIILHVEKR